MKTYPVPVGLVPAVTPKSGTRLASTVPLPVEVEVAAGADAVLAGLLSIATPPVEADGAAAIDEVAVEPEPELVLPDVMFFLRSAQSVAASGQPTPVPLKFCRVTEHASSRASWEATELSSGKVTATLGLLRTFPAATFLLSSCNREYVVALFLEDKAIALTAMKLSRLIGH